MHINRVQESSPKAFKIGKTLELPVALPPGPPTGRCPWIPLVMARVLLSTWLQSLQQQQLLFDRHTFKTDGQVQNPSQGPDSNGYTWLSFLWHPHFAFSSSIFSHFDLISVPETHISTKICSQDQDIYMFNILCDIMGHEYGKWVTWWQNF